MATGIKIHRGDQIGGCVTEIWTETTRILIDFGEELPGSKNEEKFEFPWEERPVDAVFFTHYHGDHIGRFVEACQHTDVYMSELSREVLVNIHGYLAENLLKLAKWKPEEEAQLSEEARKHAGALEILKGADQRVHTFRPHEKKPIPVGKGDILVTPFWVDHSAADACMFLIETEDQRILHTGDFRGHGIQGEGGMAMCEAVRSLAEERAIDSLIIEGTMMSRRDEKPYSEEDLRQDADRLFQDHKQVFLIISSTNLDSIQTFYQDAVKWKRPVYVYNGYLKGQLETLGKYASQRWDMSAMEDIELLKARSPDQLKDGFVAIIKANEMGTALIKRFGCGHPVVVYSMWPGYYRRKLDTALCDFVEDCKRDHVPVYPLTDNSYGPLHTSGHASPELIEQVINAAKPRELFPIHTEDAWRFLDLDISEELKEALRDRMYQEAEKAGYSPKEDHRYLSEPSLEKFLPGQPYHIFVQMVKKHPELAFCFRGNSDDAAIVYYKNHAAFHITKSGNVKFNFNHARFMPDWQERKNQLKAAGYSFENKETPVLKGRSYSIGDVSMPKELAEQLTADRLEELYAGIIRPIIESFFSAKGKNEYDRFRAECSPDHERRVSNLDLAEKQVQQQLFLSPGLQRTQDGCCIYDLEFSQPYGKLLGCINQPDMLAIRFNASGTPERLVFVEVKSTPEALGGKSGLEAHIRGMEHYPDRLLPVRSWDAYNILEQYRRLGLLNVPAETFREEDFRALPKEILLIFTGQDTIEALRKESGEKEARFLLNMGYAPLYDFPEITLDGGPLPMEAYHKDFILKGAPVHGEA